MAFSVPMLQRVQIAYARASMSSQHFVALSQVDVQTILLINNVADPVALAFAPSVPIMPTCDG